MTPCAAGEFCKHPYLPLLLSIRPCCKCQRALHEGCAWAYPNSATDPEQQQICPSCWSFEVNNTNGPNGGSAGGSNSNPPPPYLVGRTGPDVITAGVAGGSGTAAGGVATAAYHPHHHHHPHHDPQQQQQLQHPPPIGVVTVPQQAGERQDHQQQHIHNQFSVPPSPKRRKRVDRPLISKAGKDNVNNKRPSGDKTMATMMSGMKRKNEGDDLHSDEDDDSVNLVGEDEDDDSTGPGSNHAEDGKAGKRGRKKRSKWKVIPGAAPLGQETGPAAVAMVATRALLQPPNEEDRPSLIPFIVDGVDITKKHMLWQNETRLTSPFNRNSAWWLAYHQGMTLDNNTPEAERVPKAIGVCNVCGSLLQLGARSGTSSLTRHLASKHPNVHKAIMEALKEGMVLSKFYERQPNELMPDEGAMRPSVANVNRRKLWKITPHVVNTKEKDLMEMMQQRKKHPPSTTARIAKEAVASAIAAKCLDAHVIYAADRNRPFVEFDDPSFFALRQTIAETAAACARGKVGGVGIPAEDFYQLDSLSIQERAHAMAREIQAKVFQMIDGHKAPIVGAMHEWKGRTLDDDSDASSKSYQAFSIHWIQDFTRMRCVIAVNINKGGVGGILDWKSELHPWHMGTTEENTPLFVVSDAEKNSGGAIQIECLDHKLQKVADVAFAGVLGTADSIDRPPGAEALVAARRICSHFAQNEAAHEALKARQRSLQVGINEARSAPMDLLGDIGTQWWSTLAMVDRLLSLKAALEVYSSDTGFGTGGQPQSSLRMLTEVEWSTLACLQAVLKPIATATNMLQGNANVTSSLVACMVYEIREQLQMVSRLPNGEEEEEVATGVAVPSAVAGKMLDKFNEIMGDFTVDPFGESGQNQGLDHALILAHALDPRFKKLKLFDKAVRDKIWSRLLDEMVKLRPDAVKEEPTAEPSTKKAKKQPSSTLGAYAALDSSDSGEDDDDESTQDTYKAACEIELSGYKLEKGIKFVAAGEQDTLAWWSERVWRFPTLWKLCQVYFSIPATAAPSERAFRADGNMKTFKRCALSTFSSASPPEDEGALHCIHENKWVLTAPTMKAEEAVPPKTAALVPSSTAPIGSAVLKQEEKTVT